MNNGNTQLIYVFFSPLYADDLQIKTKPEKIAENQGKTIEKGGKKPGFCAAASASPRLIYHMINQASPLHYRGEGNIMG